MEQAQLSVSTGIADDDRYAEFLLGVQSRFDLSVLDSPHLFEVDAEGLWDKYLDNAPPGTRQARTCNACRTFVHRYGALVSISETGEASSVVWPKVAPPMYADAAYAIRRVVERANVKRVFLPSEATLGFPRTGPWTHLAIAVPPQLRQFHPLKTPGQLMADRTEDYRMLQRSLADFPIEFARKAHALLNSEALYRSEKVEGVARWFLELHEKLEAAKGSRARTNLVWLAVAKAPPGYCHVRSSMIGTLLEDIQADLPFETIKRRFTEKMNPLQYMRPQAPPTAGNIAQAEKIVAKLQSEGSLARRFAKLSDVQALWRPTPIAAKPAQGGVFGHLVRRPAEEVVTSDAPATLMTWSKFQATVLPTAESIEFLVPAGTQPYTAMVTAKNPDAPNLLQWGNPVSHYVYQSGSPPHQWNLVAGRFHSVTAVVLRSWMWDPSKSFDHHGAGVVFVLDGAKDTTYVRSGGMFPEQMKSEYHAVRRTLEAYFMNATVEGKDEAEVCGIVLQKGATWNLTFRVTARGVRTSYKLDRWD